jgi:hypothetical protein
MRDLIADALLAAGALSGVPLFAIAAGAGLSSLLLACFQIQEGSITHLVRLLVFTAVGVLLAQSVCSEIETLFLKSIEVVARNGEV